MEQPTSIVYKFPRWDQIQSKAESDISFPQAVIIFTNFQYSSSSNEIKCLFQIYLTASISDLMKIKNQKPFNDDIEENNS